MNGANMNLDVDDGQVVFNSPATMAAGFIAMGSGSFFGDIGATGTASVTGLATFAGGLSSTGAGTNSFRAGPNAGATTQGSSAVAVGKEAGQVTQGDLSVAVGNRAGQTSQAANSIAIGNRAGYDGQGANGIIISSTGATLDDTSAGHIRIASSLGELAFTSATGWTLDGNAIVTADVVAASTDFEDFKTRVASL
jgi:hypothetical protein